MRVQDYSPDTTYLFHKQMVLQQRIQVRKRFVSNGRYREFREGL